MNIGIINLPLRTNYGGILQNYALQTVLKNNGYTPYSFTYPSLSWKGWLYQVIIAIIHGKNKPKSPCFLRRQERPLKKFIDSHINLIHPCIRKFDLDIISKYNFQIMIAGSDQIWRPSYNPHLKATFFDFVKGADVRKVVYAASFGTDKWEYDKELTNICSLLVKDIDAVSVREKSAVGLCKRYLNIDAELVLDPTLLLTKDHYENLCSSIKRRKGFVFAYILDRSPLKISQIESYAKKKRLKCVIKYSDAGISSVDSVELWLSLFRDADYVLTDSFHGTVFSIIFNKNFQVFGNKERGQARFESLLGLFGMTDRLTDDVNNEIDDVDWKIVNSVLDERRKHSFNWLFNSIKI